MPRLTRTQKYAGLREQLANNKEENIVSQDLSSYQSRFDNVQEILAPSQENSQENAWPSFNEYNNPWKNIKEVALDNEEVKETVQEVVEEQHEEVVNDIPAFIQNEEVKAYENIEEPVQEQANDVPTFEKAFTAEVPAFEQEIKEEVKQDSFINAFVNEPVQEQANDVPAFEKAFTAEVPAFEQEIKEEPVKENSYFDSFMNEPVQEQVENNNFNSFFEDNKPAEKLPLDDIFNEVFDDVKDNSGEIVSQKDRDTYLKETIDDVRSYNINSGEQTINTTVDNLVDQIRHPENNEALDADKIEVVGSSTQVEKEDPVDNTFAWTPFSEAEVDADKQTLIDDEEFSNTVSMEISRIMDQIANAPKEEVRFEEVKEEKEEAPVVEEVIEPIQINETVVEEKPEEVVEIKNIAEIEKEPVKDTMSTTIPFIVAAEDEELLDEEDEEDGSNTVLNVILIVLIVILIAVLGLIVFYILKTKGLFNF